MGRAGKAYRSTRTAGRPAFVARTGDSKGISNIGELTKRCSCDGGKDSLYRRTHHFPAAERPCQRFGKDANVLVKILKHRIPPEIDNVPLALTGF